MSAQTVVTNLRLPGQYDERLFAAAGISGLAGPYYNWNRWYLPSMGRYMELDPVALRGYVEGFAPSWYAYVDGNPLRWIDPFGLMKLPGIPGQLPPDWVRDPTHLDPNGERYRHPSGDYLDFHKGRPGRPGWAGKDHWHHNGKDKHHKPGADVPDPPNVCDPNGNKSPPATMDWPEDMFEGLEGYDLVYDPMNPFGGGPPDFVPFFPQPGPVNLPPLEIPPVWVPAFP